MARYIVPPNIVVQGDQPITFGGVQYIQGVGALTPSERTALGIIAVVETPMPDPFYNTSTEDPAHPGQWITTPVSAADMKPRLKDYSRQQREARAAAGFDFVLGPKTYKVPTDLVSRNMLVNARVAVDRPGPSFTTRIELYDNTNVLAVVAFTSAQIVAVETQMEQRVAGCMLACSTLEGQIDAGTVTLKTQIDTVYGAVP